MCNWKKLTGSLGNILWKIKKMMGLLGGNVNEEEADRFVGKILLKEAVSGKMKLS